MCAPLLLAYRLMLAVDADIRLYPRCYEVVQPVSAEVREDMIDAAGGDFREQIR